MTRVIDYTFWLFLFTVFPLTINPFAFNMGIDKAVFFPKGFTLVVTCLLGLASLFLSYPKIKFKDLPLVFWKAPLALKFLVLLFFWLLLCGFFIVDIPLALTLLGNEYALDGLWVRALWCLLAILAASILQLKRVSTKQAFFMLIIGGAGVTTISVLQAHSLNPLAWFTGDLTYPPHSTLGHLDFLGAYASLILICVTIFALRSNRTPWWQWLSLVTSAAVLVISSNRAAFIAFWVLWLISLVIALAYPIRKKALILTAIILASMGIVYYSQYKLALQYFQPPVQETLQAAAGKDSSLNDRFIFWQVALEIIADHPLLGIGPSGFATAFWLYAPQHFQDKVILQALPPNTQKDSLEIDPAGKHLPELYYTNQNGDLGMVTVVLDEAHNYFLDFALACGLIGLFLFLGVLVSGFWVMYKNLSTISLVVIVGIMSYGIFGLVWFPALFIEPIVWGLLGLGIGEAMLARTTLAKT